MKIREIRTWVLRHELPEAEVFGSSKGWHTVRQALVVEILTEDGLTGFGEAYGPPAVNRTLVDEVYAPRLVGKNALEHGDRKSTRLNSSHLVISYAVFCLKKK